MARLPRLSPIAATGVRSRPLPRLRPPLSHRRRNPHPPRGSGNL